MSDMKAEVADIKALLRARAEDLARTLFPEGRRSGNYWLGMRNPSRNDRTPGSLWVWLAGAHAGSFCDPAADQKGDVIGTIQLARGCDFRAALGFARHFLGLSHVAPQEARRRAAAVPAPDPAKDAEALERERGRAFHVWLSCARDIEGTPAERYLNGRGIDLERLARPPRALRFSPSQNHVESGRGWPCMIALMSGPDGRPVAIHRTFLSGPSDAHAHPGLSGPSGAHAHPGRAMAHPDLDPVGVTKAPVEPARKTWPRGWLGGAIRLAKGGSGLSPEDAARNGLLEDLVLCEGIEDGLSLALACPEKRVWAVGSLGNLAAVRLPACCERVIVAADNDWGKPEAARALEKALAALAAQGRDVLVGRSAIGKDANDALLSGASVAHEQPRRDVTMRQ